MTDATPVRIPAADGRALAGRLYRSGTPRGAVLIAPATGVPQRFYAPFASWLAERSLTTLTLDYRGIGESRGPGSLRGCAARKQDWGERDLPAAFDALAERAPGLPISLIGHSAGGQLVGLMPQAPRLHRIVQVAASSGYVHGLAPRLRPVAFILLRGYMPLAARVLGYVPTKRIGWGEDLPAGVALQWARWCSNPGYVGSDLGRGIAEHYYDEIACPVLNLSATDDPIATEANVDDLLRLFPSARVERLRIDASQRPRPVDHVGVFRKDNDDLWPLMGDFLAAEAPAPHVSAG